MFHGCGLYPRAVGEQVAARSNRCAVERQLLAPLPAVGRHGIPEPIAPYDDVFGTILLQYFEKGFRRIRIVGFVSSLPRPRHRHLQVVVEDDGVPDSPACGAVGRHTDQRAFELVEGLQIRRYGRFIRQILVQNIVRDVRIRLAVRVMALAEHQDAFAEDTARSIFGPDPRLEKDMDYLG